MIVAKRLPRGNVMWILLFFAWGSCATMHKGSELRPGLSKTNEPMSTLYIPIVITKGTSVSNLKSDTDHILRPQYDPTRINNALEKIDRIASDLDTKQHLEKGYFRVVDSLRNVRKREKTKDSTIDYLKDFIAAQVKQNIRQNAINEKILKNQEDAKLAKTTFGMFDKIISGCAIIVALVSLAHFILFLSRKK